MIMDQLLSLKSKQYVHVGVLDVWSVILNDMEKYNDSSSPKRFFFYNIPNGKSFFLT